MEREKLISKEINNLHQSFPPVLGCQINIMVENLNNILQKNIIQI